MSFGINDPLVMLNACASVRFGHVAAAANGSPKYIHAASDLRNKGGGIVLRLCISGDSRIDVLWSSQSVLSRKAYAECVLCDFATRGCVGVVCASLVGL